MQRIHYKPTFTYERGYIFGLSSLLVIQYCDVIHVCDNTFIHLYNIFIQPDVTFSRNKRVKE